MDNRKNALTFLFLVTLITNTFSQTRKTNFEDEIVGKMIFVKGGNFMMGSRNGDKEVESDEMDKGLKHNVIVDDFFVAETELTQSVWRSIMGNLPSQNLDCSNCPVSNVTWNDVQQFLNNLNKKSKNQYRLLFEDEWEYVSRGGIHWKDDFVYSGSNTINEVAWNELSEKGDYSKGPFPVKKLKPNQLGVYDMSGNLFEWCQDLYKGYGNANVSDRGSNTRVIRGGSFYGEKKYCRVSARMSHLPDASYFFIGFRIATNAK